jgi:hypothetical protein
MRVQPFLWEAIQGGEELPAMGTIVANDVLSIISGLTFRITSVAGGPPAQRATDGSEW